MRTLRRKTERAPRCMGTLFVLLWSSWVPPRAPQAIAPNIHFQVSFCDFCSSGLICWPLPVCTQVENMQYRIDFIDVFDALIDSMLDHGTDTKNQKTSATLHENAPAQKETNATLHGNAFRLLMGPQSGPPKIAQSSYFKLFGTLFRPNGKTSLKDMERTATGHRKTKRQSEKMQH